jgi:hypothetical protein
MGLINYNLILWKNLLKWSLNNKPCKLNIIIMIRINNLKLCQGNRITIFIFLNLILSKR